MLRIITDEVRKIFQTPKRALEIFRPRRWRQFLSILKYNALIGNHWKSTPDHPAFKRKDYSSYDQYLRHQQSKFQYLDLADYDVNYRRELAGRLRKLPLLKKGASVLCLGARQGTEVKAFHDMGCFAVGLDLNPGKDNEFVLRGDFHQVRFPSDSVDVIFTNSFDHTFDPARLIGEIIRLLKPGGLLIIEAINGEAEARSPDHYASFWWQRIDDLVALLESKDFHVERRLPFQLPWPGEQVCFNLPKNGNVPWSAKAPKSVL